MLWNIILALLIIFFVTSFILLLIEYQKRKKNPVPLMINHDKRFSEISNRYSHKIFNAVKGKQ